MLRSVLKGNWSPNVFHTNPNVRGSPMRLAAVLALVLLAGCESDAEKLERLQQAQLTNCLAAQGERRTAESFGTMPLQRDRDQYARLDSIASKTETECTLAERDLAHFLN